MYVSLDKDSLARLNAEKSLTKFVTRVQRHTNVFSTVAVLDGFTLCRPILLKYNTHTKTNQNVLEIITSIYEIVKQERQFIKIHPAERRRYRFDQIEKITNLASHGDTMEV